jgi:hypothetical protein
MGRKIKRVPLDFDWPFEETWEGFLNPWRKNCMWCHNSGVTETSDRFESFCMNVNVLYASVADRPENFVPARPFPPEFKTMSRMTKQPCKWPWPHLDILETLTEIAGVSLSDEDAERILNLVNAWHDPYTPPRYPYQSITVRGQQRNFPHPYLTEDSISDPGTTLGPFLKGIGGGSGWSASRFDVSRKICRHIYNLEEGQYPYDLEEYKALFECPACSGSGLDPRCREKYDGWEPTPIPEGPGYQIWETVSEGSPVSPVFETKGALVIWMVEEGTTQESAEAFTKSEWVPSMAVVGGKSLQNYDTAVLANKDTA